MILLPSTSARNQWLPLYTFATPAFSEGGDTFTHYLFVVAPVVNAIDGLLLDGVPADNTGTYVIAPCRLQQRIVCRHSITIVCTCTTQFALTDADSRFASFKNLRLKLWRCYNENHGYYPINNIRKQQMGACIYNVKVT